MSAPGIPTLKHAKKCVFGVFLKQTRMRIVGNTNTRPTGSKRILLSDAFSKRALPKNRQIIVIIHYFESVLLEARAVD